MITTFLILTDNLSSSWKQVVEHKLASGVLCLLCLISISYDQAKQLIIQRIRDVEFQTEVYRLSQHDRTRINWGA